MLVEPPFSAPDVADMRRRFLANLNVNGTGATIAAPGATPALEVYGVHGGYRYDWLRDSALSMGTLLNLEDSGTADEVEHIMVMYVRWVGQVVRKTTELSAYGVAKWDIASVTYDQFWCRPQTDGPALRAQALMRVAERTVSEELRREAWSLAKFDLDWLAAHGGKNIAQRSCDLWEEPTDEGDLLWNRVAMHAALQAGVRFAGKRGEDKRAEEYRRAAKSYLRNVMADHLDASAHGDYIAECVRSTKCGARGKDIDGAVILSFIHSGWSEAGMPKEPAGLPTKAAVARTVRVHNEKFCELYSVNAHDTAIGLPGALYGRYPTDRYGGGNPWVLITAAMASLLYQAADAVARGVVVDGEDLEAWRGTFGLQFGGGVTEFIAAGDAVLVRLREHVSKESFHLYEQIDKETGLQYNAKDLTWSYAEVLMALQRRAHLVSWFGGGVPVADPTLHA